MNKPFPFQNSLNKVSQGGESVNPNGQGDDSQHGLLKSAWILSGMTLLSRLLGMIRDIVCASFFGTTWQWDAFIYAFMLPNFFRRLVGEGALSGVFVPIYTDLLNRKGVEEAHRFANVVLSFFGLSFFILIFVVEVVLFYLLKQASLSPRILLILDLLRILFPYLALMSFYSMSMGILNSHRKFFGPSLGPVLLNVLWIGGVFFVGLQSTMSVVMQLRWLAGFIILSGVLQVLCQFSFLKQVHFRFSWILNKKQEGVGRALKLLFPVILGFAVMQINLLVDMTLSFWVGPGANSSLWYGNRLMQFPLGVFAIALGTALLPTIASQASQKKMADVSQSIAFALRMVFFITIPCAVGLMVLGRPIIEILFERGAFNSESTNRTWAVLVCYSIGLFAYAGQKILISGFHGIQNTKTPMKIAVVALVANVVFNLLLMKPMGEAGLALATSLSGILQLILFYIYFDLKVVKLSSKIIFFSMVKTFLIAMIMGVVSFVCYYYLSQLGEVSTTLTKACSLIVSIIAGTLVYIFLFYILKGQELSETLLLVKRRKIV
jgi:putative peptidoglycan lipid II flippase